VRGCEPASLRRANLERGVSLRKSELIVYPVVPEVPEDCGSPPSPRIFRITNLSGPAQINARQPPAFRRTALVSPQQDSLNRRRYPLGRDEERIVRYRRGHLFDRDCPELQPALEVRRTEAGYALVCLHGPPTVVPRVKHGPAPECDHRGEVMRPVGHMFLEDRTKHGIPADLAVEGVHDPRYEGLIESWLVAVHGLCSRWMNGTEAPSVTGNPDLGLECHPIPGADEGRLGGVVTGPPGMGEREAGLRVRRACERYCDSGGHEPFVEVLHLHGATRRTVWHRPTACPVPGLESSLLDVSMACGTGRLWPGAEVLLARGSPSCPFGYLSDTGADGGVAARTPIRQIGPDCPLILAVHSDDDRNRSPGMTCGPRQGGCRNTCP